MPAFLKKSLIKWSTIAALGVSAYFLGYFWGLEKVNSRKAREISAEEGLQKAADLSKLKERIH